MKTFYAEVHVGNTDTEHGFEIQANNVIEAVRLITMFILGAAYANNMNIELRALYSAPRRGTKYERLG